MKRLFFCAMAIAVALASCDDYDSFSSDSTLRLTFSRDTVSMDTVFSTVPSSTQTFWVFNHNDDGVRLSQVRLRRGNQTGFRVNVDGTYLDNTTGSQVQGLELRKGDSLRVFVELTSAFNGGMEPQLLEDDLVFTLESGVQQSVILRAMSWDAELCTNVRISRDSTITSTMPMVIYGGLQVDSGATLTILAPTKLYFHSGAGVDVYGTLRVYGSTGSGGDVVMRGDRTDRMFDYLPYDRVSGQWRGIRFHSSSTGNILYCADIHSAEDGIVVDSAAYDSTAVRLAMENVTIHNCQGAGVLTHNANVSMVNCQVTNTLGDCLAVMGGRAIVAYCTLGQFYPFDGSRGVALRFANFRGDYDVPLHLFECYNTLVTGYAEDEIMGEMRDSTTAFGYYFSNCILRTPPTEDKENSPLFVNVAFETPTDTINGADHFAVIDTDNLAYDFHLDSLSTARGRAMQIFGLFSDRDGQPRGDAPDVGCYQYVE